MPMAAIHGANKPIIAIGVTLRLYTNDQLKFCLMMALLLAETVNACVSTDKDLPNTIMSEAEWAK